MRPNQYGWGNPPAPLPPIEPVKDVGTVTLDERIPASKTSKPVTDLIATVYSGERSAHEFARELTRRYTAYANLITALRKVIKTADEITGGEEPDGEDYDDTESAQSRGIEVGWYEAGQALRTILSEIEGQQ
jgi:hypothetical protein